MVKIPSIRICALAAALSLALPLAHAQTATSAIATKINLRTLQAQQTYDRFIVTYRNGTTENSSVDAATQGVGVAIAATGMNLVQRSANGAPLPGLTVRHERRLGIGAHLMRTSRKLSAAEAASLMGQIASDPAVAHVEADVMMHLVGGTTAGTTVAPADLITGNGSPNDPKYSYQWHFNNSTGGADVQKAWTVADGAGVTVAVIDTGITQHPDLDLSLADAGYDFIVDHLVSGRDTDGRVPGGWDTGDWTTTDPWLTECENGDAASAEASSWHGTHVAGTISELTNNSVGMAGIAHAARVLPVRALGHCGGYTSDIADAIVWASGGHVDGVPDNANPAQVISMSLGGGGACSGDDVTSSAITGAITRGVTVVVAAGNSNADVANFTPASCPGVITVASNGITGKRAFYSNYGTGVSISAPGGGIYPNDASSGTPTNNGFVWSTLNDGTTTVGNPVYGGMAGTSQATPHVSGTVALILGAEQAAGLPLSTPGQVIDILSSTARPFPVTEDHPVGVGILDAYAAVQKALATSGTEEANAAAIALNVAKTGQQGAIGSSQLYSLTVPAGKRNMNLRSYGGTGDVTMYVKAGSAPAADGSNADFTSARPGNTETVIVANPAPTADTTYYVRIVGTATYSGLSVIGTYTN